MVVAEADDPALGWWPAVVEAVDADILSLRAKDFSEVTASRHRAAVALIYTPQYVAPRDLSDAAPGLPRGWANLAAGRTSLPVVWWSHALRPLRAGGRHWWGSSISVTRADTKRALTR